MSQSDFNIANQSFPATRTDLNNALQALASNSSGDAEPSTTFANQWWYETDTNTLKLRNEANNAWLSFATVDQTTAAWTLAHDVTVSNGLTVSGAFTSLGIDDNATSNAITIDSSENVGVGMTPVASYGLLQVGSAVTSALGVGGLQAYVAGTNSALGQNGNVSIVTTDGQAANIGGSIGLGGKFVAAGTSVLFAQISGRKENGTDSNSAGYLQFATQPNGGTPLERLRIDSSGNVGIGTSSPTNGKLEVTHSSSTVPAGFFRNTSGSGNSPALTVQGGANSAAANFSVLDYNGNTDFVVQGAGNVGIGTTSPSSKISVLGGDINLQEEVNSRKIGFNVTNAFTSASSVSTAQYGLTLGAGGNGTVSLSGYEGIPFYTNGLERMRMIAAGDLLVGTTNADPGSVGSSARVVINTKNGGQAALTCYNVGTGSVNIISLENGNGQVGRIQINGTATSYLTSSDYRLKEDWQLMSGASDRVLALKPVNFAWKVDGSRVDGFLAHEVAEVVPEAIAGTKDAMRDQEYEVTAAVYEDIIIAAVLDEEGNELEAERTEQRLVTEAVMGTRSVPDYQGIDQSKLVPLLTAALQEALTEISALKVRVAALEA